MEPNRSEQNAAPAAANARLFPRLSIPPMYSLLRARPAGEDRYRWTGYIYDISEGGLRFELDQPLEPGTELEVRAMLPGAEHTTFRATGRVVRFHDDLEDAGPYRMALMFTSFTTDRDRDRMQNYLDQSGVRRAA